MKIMIMQIKIKIITSIILIIKLIILIDYPKEKLVKKIGLLLKIPTAIKD